jgi:hypothetical protein
MKKKYKVFIVVGLLLNLVICFGFYINYRLDKLVANLNKPGILFYDTAAPQYNEAGADGLRGSSEQLPYSPVSPRGDYSSGGSQTASPGRDYRKPSEATANPGNNQIVDSVAQKVNRPLEKTDLIKAGIIILKRLDTEDIGYLYRVGDSSHITREDLVQTRTVLLSKLTPEDIEVLRELGEKYGKDLRILDPSIPIQ